MLDEIESSCRQTIVSDQSSNRDAADNRKGGEEGGGDNNCFPHASFYW